MSSASKGTMYPRSIKKIGDRLSTNDVPEESCVCRVIKSDGWVAGGVVESLVCGDLIIQKLYSDGCFYIRKHEKEWSDWNKFSSSK